MYLKRLTINGFKSFATKTQLDLEPGIVAVVGPNGSGKSNIADAIRWALGEQSSKQLRLKKSEELVFAGTEKRSKGSMAEVSLLMDNADGGMAIDFSEVELSRLLYRSGESEYKLNGGKVKLSEVQHLLAQSGFGQNSYAVIGQGMIDGFILATPAERKLLFDEASGIRQYELKREAALRKLDGTEQNLVRVRDILGELAPRLKVLERSVAAAEEATRLTTELTELRQTYLATIQNHVKQESEQLKHRKQNLSDDINKITATIKSLELKRDELEGNQRISQAEQAQLTGHLHKLEAERDHLAGELSVKRAEQQMAKTLEQDLSNAQVMQKNLERELRRLTSQQQAVTSQIEQAKIEESQASGQLEKITLQITEVQAELNDLRRQTSDTSRPEYIAHALAILKQVSYGLANQHDTEELRLLVYKAGRLLSHAGISSEENIEALKNVQVRLNKLMAEREAAHEPYTKAVIRLRSLELDQENLTAQIERTQVALAEQVESVIGLTEDQERSAARVEAVASLDNQLLEISDKINELRQRLAGSGEVASTDAVFALATELESSRAQHARWSVEEQEIEIKLKELEELARLAAEKAKAWFGGAEIVAEPSRHSLDDLEKQLAVLEGRLSSSNGFDQDVAAEYAESKERYEFMSAQVSDLEYASQDLVKVIGQLEGLIKIKFEESFAGIAEHFGGFFEQLFGGGKASLSLRPDSTGTYGIEIKAVPPGKRVESLATLSGGERSMTGIALLAAILTVNPSPFVVLDEVDAALDEANSARLAKILREIAKSSQLIIITHNRQVMAAADAIFGVTMDAHHVSRLLSVKLEQARQMANA